MSQIVLAAGDDRAEIDPDNGARISSLVAGGRQRLLTRESSDGSATGWGCFLMAPWAGRISNAVIPFRGLRHPVRKNLSPHAIHGVGFDKRWKVVNADDSGCELTLTMPEDEWPFGGRLTHRVTLSEGRLDLRAEVSSGDTAMPVSLGWHPWFARPQGGDVEVRVDSGSVLVTSDDLIPTGDTAPVTGDTDLRDGPALGRRRLDTVYVSPGTPAVVRWPDLELGIDAIEPVTTIVVYSPEGAACVEPQTGWPDAPRLAALGIEGTGLLELEPGAALEATTSFNWRNT